jgi:protein tyrosine phosphatase
MPTRVPVPMAMESIEVMLHNVPRIYVVLVIFAALFVGSGTWVWLYFFDYYHYAEVQKGVLYRDGFLTVRQFNMALQSSQAKTVYSLLTDDEYGKQPYRQETEVLLHSRLKWIVQQVPLGGYPTTEQVQDFLTNVETERRQPVLVHCAQGIRRTGMMVAAYQMSVLGWDKQKTKDAIESWGHSERTIGDIKRFIDVYDPVKREVTQSLGKGTE